VELRHLRYFVAVAEEGSFLTAAQRRLHTSQPSLSRQIRDLELEVGAKLLERQARGVLLTQAGKVFLDHARLALAQVDAAAEAARQANQPPKRKFAMGFLAGQEVVWLPHALPIIRQEAPEAEIMLASMSSPDLAQEIMRGRLDVAFLRAETQSAGVTFRFLSREPLITVLRADHRLASCKKIRPEDLARESFISSARTSPVLKSVVQDYASKIGITLHAEYEAENLSSAMSLVASTGGVTLIPLYAQNMLTPNVVARALDGEPPMIDLNLGYNQANPSPLLRRFLLRADEMVANVENQVVLAPARSNLDEPAFAAPGSEADLRQLRGLAGARLAADDHHAMRADRGTDLVGALRYRQLGRILDRRLGHGPRGAARDRALQVGLDARPLGGVARRGAIDPAHEARGVGEHRVGRA